MQRPASVSWRQVEEAARQTRKRVKRKRKRRRTKT
jgi:hypothetical protein